MSTDRFFRAGTPSANNHLGPKSAESVGAEQNGSVARVGHSQAAGPGWMGQVNRDGLCFIVWCLSVCSFRRPVVGPHRIDRNRSTLVLVRFYVFQIARSIASSRTYSHTHTHTHTHTQTHARRLSNVTWTSRSRSWPGGRKGRRRVQQRPFVFDAWRARVRPCVSIPFSPRPKASSTRPRLPSRHPSA